MSLPTLRRSLFPPAPASPRSLAGLLLLLTLASVATDGRILGGAAPEVLPDSATTRRGTPVSIPVLDNDSGVWIDVDFSQGPHGEVSWTGIGSIIYTPEPSFLGVDTFTYALVTAEGQAFATDVTVTVLEGPKAVDDQIATRTDTPVTVPFLANDFGTIVSTEVGAPSHGTVVTIGQTLLYTPAAGFQGVDVFPYTFTDASGESSTAQVTVGVHDVIFVDVTLGAGIDYVQCEQAECVLGDTLHTMSGGAAAGDYDGDGDEDLFVTRLDAPGILYRNNGNATFTDVSAGAGIDLAWGSNGAAWGDIDNDGDLDLYVTSLLSDRFHLYVNDGGVFTEDAIGRGVAIAGPDVHIGYSATFGDYDKDGYLDLHTTEWRPDEMKPAGVRSNARLLRNRGAAAPGYFEDVTDAAGVALDDIPGPVAGTWAFASRFNDLDHDGWLDLTIVADAKESRLFWNNGDGTFTDGTLAAGVGGDAGDENGMGSAIGDINGDGLMDWFISSIWDPLGACDPGECYVGVSGNRLYLNNGDRTFTDVTDAAGVRDGGWGWGATFIDYDNDGDQDLVHTNGIRQGGPPYWPWRQDQMRFFENDGTGVFIEKASAVGLFDRREGKGLLKFDYDNDGDLDLFVVNSAGRPVLYRNDGGNETAWLRVRFQSPHAALGARISLTVNRGGPVQHWEVNGGNNFLGQDEMTAHFGLNERPGRGRTPRAYKLRIEMPSGVVKVFRNPRGNRTLTVFDRQLSPAIE